jgi:hypothetical protein
MSIILVTQEGETGRITVRDQSRQKVYKTLSQIPSQSIKAVYAWHPSYWEA